MRRVIILEGPDGGGKSTLADTLGKRYGCRVVHTGGPIQSKKEFKDRVEALELMAPLLDTVYDRSPFISELVYSFMAGRNPFTSIESAHKMLASARPLVIYCCLDSSEAMYEAISEKKKAHKSPEYMREVKANHSKIVARYGEIMKKIPHLTYNWKRDAGSGFFRSVDLLSSRR